MAAPCPGRRARRSARYACALVAKPPSGVRPVPRPSSRSRRAHSDCPTGPLPSGLNTTPGRITATACPIDCRSRKHRGSAS